jgi:hypothetical protein
MFKRLKKGAVALAVVAVVGIAGAGMASATTTDSTGGTIGGCNFLTWGDNTAPASYAAVQKTGACASVICVREAANSGGSIVWTGESCIAAGAAIGTSTSSGQQPTTYFGRQIRVGSSCQQDTVFTNLAASACV